MKFKNSSFYFLTIFVLFTSCAINNYVAPPFTDVEKILELNPGLTVSEVKNILKIDPYDLVHSYETGSQILIYNYRVKDRKMSVPTRSAQRVIHSADAQREGEEWYNTNYKELYLLFSNNRLKSVFGERTFSEGSYLEMVDRRLVAANTKPEEDPNMLTDSDYMFMQNLYRDRSSAKEQAKLEEDQALKKRRNFLKTAAISGGIVIVGLISGIFGGGR